MKKFDFRNIKIKLQNANIGELDDRLLLLNLYLTQALTIFIGCIWLFFQGRNPITLLALPRDSLFLVWGAGLAAAVVAVDWLLSRWMPDEASDDGGVNERIFRTRPVWHIVVICFVVSVCEEVLFRGAIQHNFGPYWTSILFAAIHVRYLRHWIPTGLVFSISYGLGWIQIQTGTIWAPIAAHFLIDVIMGLIIRFRREQT